MLIISGGQKRYQIIDFMKGFSIFTIVLMHLIQLFMSTAPQLIYKVSSLGGTGVHVFIFCSGFGLYLSYLRKPLKFAEFIKRRFLKIYIPYILVVILTFFVMPNLYVGDDKFTALLSHIFLFKMFIPQYESSFGGQLWYISTIFQFYFVFNALCLLRKKMSAKLFLLLALCVSCMWWIFTAVNGLVEERIWNSFFLQYLWEFSLGMVLAEKLEEGKNFSIYRPLLLGVAIIGIGLQTILAFKGGVFRVINDVPALLGYGALIILIYSLGNLMLNKVVLWIANISYEWYLLHILVLALIFQFCPHTLILEIVVGIIGIVLSLFLAYMYQKVGKIKLIS